MKTKKTFYKVEIGLEAQLPLDKGYFHELDDILQAKISRAIYGITNRHRVDAGITEVKYLDVRPQFSTTVVD